MADNRYTTGEKLFFAAFAVAVVVIMWAALPADGILCVGPNAVDPHGRLVECAEMKQKYGAKCDVRLPSCFFGK